MKRFENSLFDSVNKKCWLATIKICCNIMRWDLIENAKAVRQSLNKLIK